MKTRSLEAFKAKADNLMEKDVLMNISGGVEHMRKISGEKVQREGSQLDMLSCHDDAGYWTKVVLGFMVGA